MSAIGHLERLGFGQACVSHWDSVLSLLRTAGVARADNNNPDKLSKAHRESPPDITEATQAHPEEGLQDTGRRRCTTCKEEENNDHDNPDHHIKHGSKANSEHGGDSKADTEQDTEDNSPTD
ncbi:hypothetical protein BFJ68_g12518 [Fusarium oxysporum]|uniref:Uncharacterized protein n=1 Tax=Fusarium oxysporum TaxID=5507 RepID=A0A420QUA4_FUSOX|nr:hypothetical protein BFJ68_g12518 [Fusarium oxysporum]RKL08383.1 hypothetical protein BFJ71_g1673 [Fusarium oxysporum]